MSVQQVGLYRDRCLQQQTVFITVNRFQRQADAKSPIALRKPKVKFVASDKLFSDGWKRRAINAFELKILLRFLVVGGH